MSNSVKTWISSSYSASVINLVWFRMFLKVCGTWYKSARDWINISLSPSLQLCENSRSRLTITSVLLDSFNFPYRSACRTIYSRDIVFLLGGCRETPNLTDSVPPFRPCVVSGQSVWIYNPTAVGKVNNHVACRLAEYLVSYTHSILKNFFFPSHFKHNCSMFSSFFWVGLYWYVFSVLLRLRVHLCCISFFLWFKYSFCLCSFRK